MPSGASLGFDILEYSLDLFDRKADRRRDLLHWYVMVQGVETQVHTVIRQCEIELLLGLRH